MHVVVNVFLLYFSSTSARFASHSRHDAFARERCWRSQNPFQEERRGYPSLVASRTLRVYRDRVRVTASALWNASKRGKGRWNRALVLHGLDVIEGSVFNSMSHSMTQARATVRTVSKVVLILDFSLDGQCHCCRAFVHIVTNSFAKRVLIRVYIPLWWECDRCSTKVHIYP